MKKSAHTPATVRRLEDIPNVGARVAGLLRRLDITAPDAGEPASTNWRVEFLLQSTTDPSLLIPAAQVWQEYTVQKGDSLSKISERYYGTMSRVKDICELNQIAVEDLIYAGQKIYLPK